MLDSEEIDDDYFTPIPNTSLKNIFGSTLNPMLNEIGDPLKYSPPKAEVSSSKLNAETKNKCIFACTLQAYEWSENAYKPKGKVGLAIVKTSDMDSHSIILYDSNKTSQSKTSITPNLQMMMKDNKQLLFYDDQQKYWVLTGLEPEISELVQILKKLGVKISLQTAEGTTGSEVHSNDQGCESIIFQLHECKKNTGNETDSSKNMRSKVSILNRMANMGQSVFPRQTLSKISNNSNSESSSSSTDSDSQKISNIKKANHQTCKSVKAKNIKREVPDIALSKVIQSPNSQVFHMTHSQVVPYTNPSTSTTIASVCSNTGELNHFISEQRISNTEIRLNINKTTDKIDQVLEILKNPVTRHESDKDFEINIMKKLLDEYEDKIKNYEQKLKAPHFDIAETHCKQFQDSHKQQVHEYEEKIKILHDTNVKMCTRFENDILVLQEKLELYGKENSNKFQYLEEDPDTNPKAIKLKCNIATEEVDIQSLKNKIQALEDTIIVKDNLLTNLQLQIKEDNEKSLEILTEKDNFYSAEIKKLQETISKNVQENESHDVEANIYENKLKKLMNEVFQLISINFENNELYSGENIKKVVASVIKKSTNEYLRT